MVKKTLTLDYTPVLEMGMVGVVTPVKAYRVSNALNQQLHWHLKKQDSVVFPRSKRRTKVSFYKFGYTEEVNRVHYYLLSNRAEGVYFLPERKEADFLIIVKGARSKERQQTIRQQVNKLSIVQTAFSIEPRELDSKENLLLL